MNLQYTSSACTYTTRKQNRMYSSWIAFAVDKDVIWYKWNNLDNFPITNYLNWDTSLHLLTIWQQHGLVRFIFIDTIIYPRYSCEQFICLSWWTWRVKIQIYSWNNRSQIEKQFIIRIRHSTDWVFNIGGIYVYMK